MSVRSITWLPFLILAWIGAGAAVAQETPDPLVGRLVAQGLENVVVQRDGAQIHVSYENRRYRWQVTGLGVALAAAAKDAPAGTELVVTPKVWGVPDLEARVKAEDY